MSTGSRKAKRVAWAVAALCLLAPLAWPAGGQAVTVGAPLSLTPNAGAGCEGLVLFGTPPSCSVYGLDPTGSWTSQTPPGSWVLDRGRVRAGAGTGPMVFTVVRAYRSQATKDGKPAGIICCVIPFESQVFTPAPNTITEVPLNLPVVNTVELVDGEPVEVVDYLGISILSPGVPLPMHYAPVAGEPGSTSAISFFAPAARAGQERLTDGSYPGLTPLINADYQPVPSTTPVPGSLNPTAPPFSLLPGVKLLGNGTRARLGVNAPGPGLLRAGLARGGAARVSVAPRKKGKKGKKRKPRLLGSAKRRVKKAGKAFIAVRLTKVGKRLLERRGKLRLPVRVTFKPDGGKKVGATRKVTFKKKRRRKGKSRGKGR